MTPTTGCPDCGFTLHHPITTLTVSTVGLYNDARFPGRSILVLNNHHEDLADLPTNLAAAYHADLTTYATALRQVTGTPRLNYAILGNTEPHIHCHIIPRYPATEALPGKSPWNDPRPHAPLPDSTLTDLVQTLRDTLTNPVHD